MHFYESSIITTVDGLQCQVYSNEHPVSGILVKPKYIPTDRVESAALPYRFIGGKKMNRLNWWIDRAELRRYITRFQEAYPEYVFRGGPFSRERLFFIVPIGKIERVYYPRRGLTELMGMPQHALDEHLHTVSAFVQFVLGSGIPLKQIGVTYSTLMGHYFSSVSDINLVVYGKDSYRTLLAWLETAQHPSLRWKTDADWMQFYKGRNRFAIFTKDEFLRVMRRKKSEGYFNNTLFVLFCAEEEHEVWSPWGSESYEALGTATVEGTVADDTNGSVRPGCYDITDSQLIAGPGNVPVKRVVFYSRDYCLLARRGERIRACGLLEKVTPRDGGAYYRVAVGYFDAYISERREKEYIKVLEGPT